MVDLDMRHLSPERLASKHAYYLASFERRFWERVPPGPGCRPWSGARVREGYGQLTRLGKILKAHRVAWELTYGPIPEGLVVCHRCDNPPCCEPSHLFLGTRADNNEDCILKGRQIHVRGSRHGNAKLTEEQVADIRRRYRAGEKGKDLALEYGVRATTVSYVIRGGWAHVEDARG